MREKEKAEVKISKNSFCCKYTTYSQVMVFIKNIRDCNVNYLYYVIFLPYFWNTSRISRLRPVCQTSLGNRYFGVSAYSCPFELHLLDFPLLRYVCLFFYNIDANFALSESVKALVSMRAGLLAWSFPIATKSIKYIKTKNKNINKYSFFFNWSLQKTMRFDHIVYF